MIPFKELQNLCDQLRDKTGAYCSVSVSHNAWDTEPATESTHYSFYIAGVGHSQHKTTRELKFAINNILNPKEDAGVSLSEGP